MSLLFVDSFDHYVTADLGKKYQKVPDTTAASIVASQGRGAVPTSAFRLRNYTGGDMTTHRRFAATSATYYWGFAYKQVVYHSQVADQAFTALYNSTTAITHIRYTISNAGAVKIYRGSTLLATATVSMGLGAYHFWEFKVILHATTGVAEMRLDGVVVATFTGNTINSGAGVADTIAFGEAGNGVNAWDSYIDDFYVCDGAGSINNTYLGDVRVVTILPTGAGNSTGMTPSTGANYAAVNEAAQNGDTTYVSSAVAGTKDTYAYADLPATALAVVAVQASPVVRKEDAGSRTFASVARIGSTDYDGATKGLSTSYEALSHLWETSPATSAAWTVAAVNAAEFGAKVVS